MIGSFCPKHIMFQLENFIMTLKCDAKFKWKLTCGLKNDTRNLVNFHASSRKSEKLHFDGLLLPKTDKNLDEEVQKSLITPKSDAKFEEKLALGSKNDIGTLVSFNASSSKSDNLHFDVLLLSKVYYVSATKCRGVISHNTEKWCKIWGGTN